MTLQPFDKCNTFNICHGASPLTRNVSSYYCFILSLTLVIEGAYLTCTSICSVSFEQPELASFLSFFRENVLAQGNNL